jgi:hypothetical protein
LKWTGICKISDFYWSKVEKITKSFKNHKLLLNDPSIWRPGAILRFFPDKNVKISWNRVHIQIQQPKVSIKRYIILHIEKVCFQPKKWLSVKIWPLKKFFFVKIDFFSRIEWFGTKNQKKIFGVFRKFSKSKSGPKRQKKFAKTGQNRLFSVYFRELSDLEQKMKKKFFRVFFIFLRFFFTQKGPKSRFWEFSQKFRFDQNLDIIFFFRFPPISEKSLDPINLNSL